MTKNIRRFATALTLTAVLASTSAFAGPNRTPGGDVPERPALVRIVQKLLKKLGLQPTSGISIPIPPNSPDHP